VSTPVTVYVPGDASALSLGAEWVARAIEAEAGKRGAAVRVVRNGSRGLFWLEPMVEVVTPTGRVAYGPVRTSDVGALLDAGMLEGGAHPLRHGDIAAHPWLTTQQRLTSARVGVIDPTDIDDYIAQGGYAGLANALTMPPSEVVKVVTDSGLRGRGGAAFPTGIKWKTVLDQVAPQKYIACNADEGDSGTFADRMLMEGDPFSLIEGMTIAGLAVGATRGYIYLRVEYPHAARALAKAISVARSHGYWAKTCAAAAGRSTSRCGSAPARTSAAKKRRCSRAWRGAAAKCACVRHCPRSRVCSDSRRW
jgi:formate dehydrogenase iron-sulfur subunit